MKKKNIIGFKLAVPSQKGTLSLTRFPPSRFTPPSFQILYGHVDNVSNAQLETARRAAALRADVDAALDALLGPGAAAELRAASAGAAAEARRARLSAVDSATRFARFTEAYAGVLCSAVLFGKVAAGCGGKEEAATAQKAPLMLPAPKAAKSNAVPFSVSSSSLSTSSAPSDAPLSSAQERWAAAAADAAFGQGRLAASSPSSPSTSSSSVVGGESHERHSSRRRGDGAEGEGAHEDNASSASSGTTAAAFAFLGVLPFGLLPFLRRGRMQ